MNKKIAIFGATGLIGKDLTDLLLKNNYEVKIFTRNVSKAGSFFQNRENLNFEKWSLDDKPTFLYEKLADIGFIINLTGASVAGKRWNTSYKKLIYDSRINSTKLIIDSLKLLNNKPSVFINSSAVGIYGSRKDVLITEDSELGNDFLTKVCIDWEKEAYKAEQLGIRTVCLRTGLVLSKDEGALKEMLTPFKFFVGGPIGKGKQWYSWIHIYDIINLFIFALENENIRGPLNGTAPNPVRNKEFSKLVGKVLKRPSWLSVPKFALKIIAGEIAEYLVTGQRVVPKKAIDQGFTFKFPKLDTALYDLLLRNE